MKKFKVALLMLIRLGWLTFVVVFLRSEGILISIPTSIILIILAILSMILSIIEVWEV